VAFQDFKGTYHNKSTGATIRIKSKKNKTTARKGIIRIPLIPFDSDQFYAPENQALFIFMRDAAGQITGFRANAYDFRNFNFNKKL
jgi:hypothetical protein